MAIDFTFRDFFDPFTILRLRNALKRAQWDEDYLRAYQQERLRAIVRHAAQHVPHYQRQFRELGLSPEDIECAEDLKRLPPLSRDTVREDGSLFLADDYRRYRPVIAHTSGSSGVPLEFYLDRESNALEFVHYWRHWGWAGYRLGDRFAELASVHFLNRPQLDGKISDLQRWYGRLMLNSMKLTSATVGEYICLLEKFKPRYLKGLPSALYHLAILIGAAKPRIAPMRAVFSSGENVTPEMRVAIENTFQCRLLDCYGHMERTVCIAQCFEGSYHVLSDYGLLELGERGPSANPGVELAPAIGTSLYNRAMPLLRYEIGDLIEVYAHPPRCRCGRSFPVIRGVRGRMATAIVTPEGRVESALFALPAIVPGIAFLQFVQHRRDFVEVRVVRTPAFDRGCESMLMRCLSEALGASIQVRVVYLALEETEKDASGKRPVVISAVAPSAPVGESA